MNAEGSVVVNRTSPTASNLYSVRMTNANDGWTVSNTGLIFRWNGTDWNSCASPTTERLLSLFMTGEDSGWAVGYSGTIVYWTGTEWIPEFSIGILMLLLIGVCLISIMLVKTTSRAPCVWQKLRLYLGYVDIQFPFSKTMEVFLS